MRLWREIEDLCATIKYDSSRMDPNDVRATLRRAQYMVDAVTPLLHPDTLTVRTIDDDYDDFLVHEVTITTKLTKEQYISFLELMIDKDDEQ